MQAQLQALKSRILGVKAELDANKGKAECLAALNEAEARIGHLDGLGIAPNRDNVEAIAGLLVAAVAARNAANQITAPTVADILTEFDSLEEPA